MSSTLTCKICLFCGIVSETDANTFNTNNEHPNLLQKITLELTPKLILKAEDNNGGYQQLFKRVCQNNMQRTINPLKRIVFLGGIVYFVYHTLKRKKRLPNEKKYLSKICRCFYFNKFWCFNDVTKIM